MSANTLARNTTASALCLDFSSSVAATVTLIPCRAEAFGVSRLRFFRADRAHRTLDGALEMAAQHRTTPPRGGLSPATVLSDSGSQ